MVYYKEKKMKRLPSGATAYYPNTTVLKVLAILFALLGIFFFCASFDRAMALCSVVLAFLFGWQGFFPSPVCLIYLEKIEWYHRPFLRRKKYSLLWEEIAAFHLKEEWVKHGKNNVLARVIVFQTHTPTKEPLKIRDFFLLKKAEREHLLNELRVREILQEPDEKYENLPNFIRNLYIRK